MPVPGMVKPRTVRSIAITIADGSTSIAALAMSR